MESGMWMGDRPGHYSPNWSPRRYCR